MNGFLIVDKPAGITSFDVVRAVRRLAGTRKVGHAGTLDPMATGVLPVAAGSATRLLEYLMGGEKTYRATLKLGTTTDTQDAEGQVLQTRPWDHVTRDLLHRQLDDFRGAIEQLPPMYSAIKQNGQPLYKLARKGEEVERKTRRVTIHALELTAFEPPRVELLVTCSKGTYIRTLAADLGEALGCGAHLTALRRTRNGLFDETDSVSLDRLQALADSGDPLPWLSPTEALADWPAIEVAGPVLDRLRNGVAPAVDAVVLPPGLRSGQAVRFQNEAELVAIGDYSCCEDDETRCVLKILKVFPQVRALR